MLKTRPYFMENPEWYYHDDKINKYFLTDKAPKEAVESYNDFYDDDVDLGLYADVTRDAINYLRDKLRKEGKSEQEIDEYIEKWKNFQL